MNTKEEIAVKIDFRNVKEVLKIPEDCVAMPEDADEELFIEFKLETY